MNAFLLNPLGILGIRGFGLVMPFWELAAAVAGNAIGGIFGSKSAKKQAKAQERAAELEAETAKLQIEEARRQYDTGRADLAPWRASGMGANNWLTYLTQPDAPDPTRLNRIARAQARIAELNGYLGIAPNNTTQAGATTGTTSGTPAWSPSLPRTTGDYARDTVYGAFGGIPDSLNINGPGGGAWNAYQAAQQSGNGANIVAPTNLTPEQKQAYEDELALLTGKVAGWQSRAGQRGKEDLVTKYLRSTPGYQFNFKEGQKAVERSALAGGRGGRALKALTRWGQNYADQEYDDWVNMLQFQSGSGQNAAAQTGSLGASASGQIQSALGNYGAAQAGGVRGAAAANAGAYDSWGNAFGNMANDAMWAYYNRDRSLNEVDTSKYQRLPSPGGNTDYQWG